MGYIAANEYAWDVCCQLIHETVKTAAAAGLDFDEEKFVKKLKILLLIIQRDVHLSVQTCVMAEKTEVDTISGAVVRAAHKHGVEVPGHECIVRLVHAMEGRNK